MNSLTSDVGAEVQTFLVRVVSTAELSLQVPAVFVVETRFRYVTLAGLELTEIHFPLPPGTKDVLLSSFETGSDVSPGCSRTCEVAKDDLETQIPCPPFNGGIAGVCHHA